VKTTTSFHRTVAWSAILALLVMLPALQAQEGVPRDGLGTASGTTPHGPPRLPAAPEAFGGNTQWTVYHASLWGTWGSTTVNPGYAGSGYIYPTNPSDDFWVQVLLPKGAHVSQVQWLVYDNDTSCNWYMNFSRYESAWDGSSPGTEDIVILSPDPDATPGYIMEWANTDVTIRAWEDIDGDGLAHYVGYLLGAQTLGCGGGTSLRLFGAALVWERTVSPAPATATFTDVPTGHWAYQFVEALAASGITAGCGGGNYCPDNPITRAEMAVYLASALGLHWAQ